MEILEFLKEWSPVIVPALVIVFDLLILLLKNRPMTTDDINNAMKDVLNVLPGFINYVECPGNGNEKKQEVISMCLELLQKKLKRDLSVRENRYFQKTISEQIEVILTTPQKKGD